MPQFKARTDDWNRLATEMVRARDYMRATWPCVENLRRDLANEMKALPRAEHANYTYVRTAALKELLQVWTDVGIMFTSALKNR